ncbi:MAG: LysM peptidoglycan-binding domain-containing protein [Sporomusa sp.]
MDIYIAKTGDTVDSIASAYDIPVDSIIYNNQVPYPYQLAVGQALLLSTGVYAGDRPDIYTNGYAYPFISPYVLRQTLPFLTELSIFSYGFTTQGYLVPPPLDESYMIAAALQFNTLPVLTLTPFDETGKFNNYLISAITNDSQAQDLLISQIINVMQEKGYRGLNIDFEYILAEDKIPFVDFVWNARNTLNELGYFVSVALPPKISDEQGGALLGGFDYALLGEAANYLFLMTYEYGYT